MKERIIDALDRLAFSERSEEKERKKSEQLMQTTQVNLGIDPLLIAEKARKTLSYILHNYEAFQVMTIDKFSLRLIRTFAKDLNINDDFEVILSEDELIEQVVDELLSKLGATGHESITHLALRYAKSNLLEGDKWNFRKELIDFAKVLKSEKDQESIDKILKQSFEDSSFQEMLKELQGLTHEYIEQKKGVLELFQSFSIQEDEMPYKGKGLHGYLSKHLPNSDLNNPAILNSYVEKTLSGEIVKANHRVPSELVQAIECFRVKEDRLYKRYFLVKTLRKNFHNLALLKYIAQELAIIKERDNLVRISEFNRMISSLLVEEKAPYIYERLGTRYSHYLLDEFQDTSRLQWMNLLPLVHDAISQGAKNLIVGDPKQAIYRFRNGLVEQFVALPAIYNPENDPKIKELSNYFENAGMKSSLEQNWRSQENIVRFNNAFFKHLITMLPEDFKAFYSDVVQEPKGKKGGYVSFEFADKAKEVEEAYILSVIRSCEADGFKRGDICLLSRGKKEAKRWAKYLAKAPENYKVVSADSLTVSSDKAVQVCMDYFYLRRNAKNKTIQIKFAVSYLTSKNIDPLDVLNDYWGKRVGDLKFDKFLIDFFKGKEAFFFNYENLYDLGRQLINLLAFDELKNPYLHHFMEILHRYDLRLGPDLRGFIDFWETKGRNETVQIPENDAAIQIMTVHKAKGLEFPVVILPSLNWEFGVVKSPQFVEVEEGGLIHLKLVKDNAPDYILERYEQERSQQLLDEVNLFYVAVTRPVNRLYALVERSKKKTVKDFSGITNFCENVLSSLEIEGAVRSDTTFQLGDPTPKEEGIKEGEAYFNPKNVTDCLWFPNLSLQDEDALELENLSEEQQYGNQLHEILSKAKTIKDLKDVVNSLVKSDSLEKKFVARLETEASKVLSDDIYIKLFQGVREIVSEQDLIIDTTKVKRPDMILIYADKVVVVDYKTGEERNSHNKQLLNYVAILKEMGYSNVCGKLIYTNPFKILDVAKIN